MLNRSTICLFGSLKLKSAISVTLTLLFILAAAHVIWKIHKPLLVVAGVIFLVWSAVFWSLNRKTRQPACVQITELLLTWIAAMVLLLGAVYYFDRAGWIWFTLTGYDTTFGEDLSNQVGLSTGEFVKQHQYISMDSGDSRKLLLRKGQYSIDDTIVIPQGTSLMIEPGTVLRFRVGRSLISYSPIIARGTASEPIVFTAQNEWLKWGAVGIVGPAKSVFEYVRFEYGRYAWVNNLDFLGNLSLIGTEVEITHSQFLNQFGKNAVYIRQGEVFIRDNIMQNTFNDCLDLDGGGGEISHNQFIDCGDNGIDLSENQHVQVFDNIILDAFGGRKGIGADNNLDEIRALNTFGYSSRGQH